MEDSVSPSDLTSAVRVRTVRQDTHAVMPRVRRNLWASRNPASRSLARSLGGGGYSTTPILFMLDIVMFVPWGDIS